MEQILAKHPDLKHIVDKPYSKTYKVLDNNNTVIEQWEKNSDGHWIDVTERVKAEQELLAAKQELDKLSRR